MIVLHEDEEPWTDEPLPALYQGADSVETVEGCI